MNDVLQGDSRGVGFIELFVGLGQRQAFGFHGDDDVVVLSTVGGGIDKSGRSLSPEHRIGCLSSLPGIAYSTALKYQHGKKCELKINSLGHVLATHYIGQFTLAFSFG